MCSVVQAGHSVLIFCCSKVQCEVTAKYIAKILTIPERQTHMPAPQQDSDTPGGVPSSARMAIVAELSRYKGSDSGGALRDVVAQGAAWHHSGLNGDQRELVEKAFLSGMPISVAVFVNLHLTLGPWYQLMHCCLCTWYLQGLTSQSEEVMLFLPCT